MHRRRLRAVAAAIARASGLLLLALAIVALSIHLNSQQGPDPVAWGGIVGGYGILTVVRWINRRDDPRKTPSAKP